ncbi:aspartate/glutamate racemase family protein [Bradyrhizobium aeschynomenes]|uniref:aspartate/glutamate racemase family protein n=1 Tax=Bradyrhizobium aeschynomenes TaxID=2734909 RepID=UPI001552C686|nr:aspartate/glutamate racemase family protein [Bradyrhizobium aeschynomenes]NPV21134.1 aspartate/glutamate racemase family protein [Bradyrhizobium aeschynomenes]
MSRPGETVINVINPNITATMTDLIAQAAQASASPSTRIVGRTARFGAASIEGHYDEAIAAVGMLKEVEAGDAEGCHAHVIACFGDPGLLAARELSAVPVLGIAEAAMHAASFVATHFSIVTTLSRTKVIAEHLVRNYGMEHHCRKVRAVDVAVLDLDKPEANVRGTLLGECRAALREDGIGAIVLGCAGMADLAHDLSTELGIPVIDGVAAAVRFAEALVGLGLKTSKHGDLAFPLPKARTTI